MTGQPQDPRVRFVLDLGLALHRFGVSSHRLEGALTRVTETLGLSGSFFSTPTALMISIDGENRTHLLRTEPGEVDLARMCTLDELANDVVAGATSPAQGCASIRDILGRPALYGRRASVVAYTVGSGAAAVFLAGGLMDALISAVAGLIIGLLAVLTTGRPAVERLFLLIASLASAGVAWTAAAAGIPVNVLVVTIAGLIAFVPGLSLTIAMTELANGQLASGTARLSYVGIVLIQMGLGVALASRLGTAAQVELASPHAISPLVADGWWWMAVALPLAIVSFMILLRARLADYGWILGTGALAMVAAVTVSGAADPIAGSFAGALAAAIASNIFARWRDRPAANLLVPSLFLLVPGSVGLRSVDRLLQDDVLGGVHTAFEMSLIAVALVAGILVANLVFPARRHL